METLERLRHRIDTTKEMQAVVRTMKGLAAVNIRSFETAANAVDHYMHTVVLGLQVLISNEPDKFSPLVASRRSNGITGVIVFGSEQGLCGSFNRLVSERAAKTLQQTRPPKLAAAGLRLLELMKLETLENLEQLSMPASVDGIADCVTDTLELVTHWLKNKDVTRIELVHNRLTTSSSYTPIVFTLFPFDQEWLHQLRSSSWESRCLPTLLSPSDTMLRSLIRHHLFIGLYRAFAESLAAEHAARLAAMQVAEKNIKERLAGLELSFHQQRQATITEELLDVVSGFEALK